MLAHRLPRAWLMRMVRQAAAPHITGRPGLVAPATPARLAVVAVVAALAAGGCDSSPVRPQASSSPSVVPSSTTRPTGTAVTPIASQATAPRPLAGPTATEAVPVGIAPSATSVVAVATNTPQSIAVTIATATVTATVTGAGASSEEETDPSRFGVVVSIDAAQHHPISPLIYGVANSAPGDADTLSWLGATLVRWGGNARTRHNWEINASNAGSDWEFRNVSQGDNIPGSASVQFILRNQSIGARSLLTIPMIGWVAKDGNNDSQSVNVPEHGGPAIAPGSDIAFTQFSNGAWTKPYDPTDNRLRTSVQSLPSKGAPFTYPPDLTDGKVYQDEWVAYLRSIRRPGDPPNLYAMDNEPELWADDTHVDVHPVRMGYDDLFSTFTTYARAVKKADPDALILGPEGWGVTAYLFSALDEGGDRFATAADRAAHKGLPWIEWFLMAMSDSDRKYGARTLDVLTVHYYPNTGAYSGGNDQNMQDKRMQAPRALWDSTYVEPSWVARTEWPNLALVRRLFRLIEQHYPGTKLGITEWNYGGENDISGAIATADALGIYGREGVYLASYWQFPARNSASGWAFRLYRNYDGQGSTFGSESVETESSDYTWLSAYGAMNPDGTRLTLMLINKQRTKQADVQIKLKNFTARTDAEARQYGYSQADLSAIVQERQPPDFAGPDKIRVTVAPMSIKLVVVEGQPSPAWSR